MLKRDHMYLLRRVHIGIVSGSNRCTFQGRQRMASINKQMPLEIEILHSHTALFFIGISAKCKTNEAKPHHKTVAREGENINGAGWFGC